MSILIVSATSSEVRLPLKYLKQQDIHLLRSGVGGVPSLYAMLKAVHRYQPQIMIQLGIGGSFETKYRPGCVVAINKDGFGDLGVMEQQGWKSVFDLGFADPNKKPFKAGWLTNPNKRLLRICELPLVAGTTVNEVTTNKQRSRALKLQGAVVESMEGASFHYVGIMEKIPFIQLRGISNFVGERDKSKWNFSGAIENVNEELIKLLSKVYPAI